MVVPASRAPALGEPSRGLSRRQPGDGSRWDGALAARRRAGGEASLIGSPLQRERPAGILPATAAASCDSRPSRCGDFLLGRVSCENAVFLVVALQCQKPNVWSDSSQSVSVTHLLAWRTGPHAHTRCTRLAREPTRGTLSPAVAPGPDCWTHSTQLTEQLTRWRCIVGFSGTDTGEEGGAQGQDTGLTN